MVSEKKECITCSGSGQCWQCNGRGYFTCMWCGGSGNCTYCGGSGEIGEDDCWDCLGTGNCQDCGGDGEEDCRTCNTTGKCPYCRGTGQEPNRKTKKKICFTRIVRREIPCNKCFTGICPKCNGAGYFSITCWACNGRRGHYTTEQTCPKCEGSGHLSDGTLCGKCGGRGTIFTDWVRCSYCQGSGIERITCQVCDGTRRCPTCKGRGKIIKIMRECICIDEEELKDLKTSVTRCNCESPGICLFCQGSGCERCKNTGICAFCNGIGFQGINEMFEEKFPKKKVKKGN